MRYGGTFLSLKVSSNILTCNLKTHILSRASCIVTTNLIRVQKCSGILEFWWEIDTFVRPAAIFIHYKTWVFSWSLITWSYFTTWALRTGLAIFTARNFTYIYDIYKYLTSFITNKLPIRFQSLRPIFTAKICNELNFWFLFKMLKHQSNFIL